MALGKTVSYQPFNETSFGYGSNEIATAHSTEFPNGTDIVRVTIEHLSGNWDSTGHLATPSVGTAVATYHKQQEYWTVKGQRDDVDAVLAAMSFFPADKEETRLWNPTAPSHALKDNQTSGTYADEEPPTIGDTEFTVRVYDGITVVSTQTLTFAVTEAVFGNQRPYWQVAPSTEDLNTGSHDSVAGGLVDFGTLSHGTDTENVQIKCEFRPYGSTVTATTGAYGKLTQDENIFIGDKKPSASNFTDARFDFTGSVAEANAFLDNVRYYNAGNQKTFDMFLTVTDGVVGSTLTKTCYFSDATIGVSTLPDVHYVEDQTAFWDFGIVNFSNIQPDVTQYSCTVTFDATGHSGITNGYFGGVQYVDGQPLTTTRSTLAELKQDLRFLEVYFAPDFNSSFNFTVDFTFSNPTLGTSYTATQQSIAVTAEEKSEVTAGITSTHEYTEDQHYDFGNVFQITHGYNHQFDVEFTLSDTDAGVLWRHGSSGFWRVLSAGVYKLSGSRDEVNTALQNVYFAPATDYVSDFTIGITVDRTSGDLTFETQSTGTFTMSVAEDLPEFTFPISTADVNWENNVSNRFVSGLQITDTSVDNFLNFEVFGSTFTVVARLRQDGSAFTHGSLSTDVENVVVTNDFTNEITLVGTKDVLNVALNDLRFIPDPDYDELHNFYIDYKITRDFDGVVLLDQSQSYTTLFTNPTITAPFSVNTQLFDWTEDTILTFDSKLLVTEKITLNTDYVSGNGYDDWYGGWHKVSIRSIELVGVTEYSVAELDFTTSVDANANLTISGTGKDTDPLVLSGTSTEINKALASLTMTPKELDFTTTGQDNGGFWLEAKIERYKDNKVHMNFDQIVANFNEGTQTGEYDVQWRDTIYTEDIQNQYIFAHLDSIITDGAGDFFDVTYDVTIALGNETTGKFVPYVEEGYLLDDDINIFVTDYAVRLVGTKTEVNDAIKQIQFSPYPDVFDSVEIRYDQKRIYNNTTAYHAVNALVATMQGIETPELVYGTATGNLQFFANSDQLIGVDRSKTDAEILSGAADAILTPRLIAENTDRVYDRPITVTDTYEDGGESLYRIIFEGGTLFTPLGASLNITDTGYQTKDELNAMLDDGIYVTGVTDANDNLPDHASIWTANFTLNRRTANGVDAVIRSGSLRYMFVSGLKIITHVGTQELDLSNAVDGQADSRVQARSNTQFYTNQIEVRRSNNQVWLPDFDGQLFTKFYSVAEETYSDYHPNYVARHEIDGVQDGMMIVQYKEDDYSPHAVQQALPVVETRNGGWFGVEKHPYGVSVDYELGMVVWTEWGSIVKAGAPFKTDQTDPAKLIIFKG